MSIKARASSESTATVNGSIGRSLTNDTARQKATKRALKTFNYANSDLANTPTLVLVSLNDTFATKTIDLFEPIKVGRKLNPKVAPEANNGIFDAKVLSRNHAEIWFADGKVWVKDVKSSNGTFLNGKRLSDDNVESEPHELNSGDRLEFGLDIKNPEETAVIYKKVSCKVSLVDPSQLSAPSAPELAGEPGRG
ncbi:SMAD/FHA domain-containing protein [Geranomyces variabilis]|nr:SMAD/FHA domain-containing protein [Geranomyces variabilis]